MLKEFKDFIAGGSVMDMAVGIIMGGAIGALVTSLVEDLLNPIIGLFMGGVDFSKMGVMLSDDPEGGFFGYGNFIMAIINFLIIAWVIFMIVKMVNRVKAAAVEEKPAEDPGPSEKDILMEIRDSLAK
jgi:large conductance mechanosensitive channel